MQLGTCSPCVTHERGWPTPGKGSSQNRDSLAQVPECLQFPRRKGCQGELDPGHPIRSSSWIETQHLPSQHHPAIPFLIWKALS